ncbi:MAG: hypothetical protein PHU85_17660, partial [Phycisphaerae bacterium]|nr:hypothetical protein [Phycisphaerae bacterium]
PHVPTVVATISRAADAVSDQGVVLDGPKAPGKELPQALYVPTGAKVTNGKATTTAIGRLVNANRLLLASTKGFAPGDRIICTRPGEFPATNCFIFFGFYGLGQYEDVFQFLPGAIGVHVDSSCMTWASGAMHRGMAATFGVTTEPLSIGIPWGDQMILALGDGYNWADAVYGSLRLGQRWAGVTFGDPLYAPFRSLQKADKTPPAIGAIAAKAVGKDVAIRIDLAGEKDDELADVALFRIDYGPTASYGKYVDFIDWPEPQKSKGVQGRRYGYSRHATLKIPVPAKGETVHYRVTARDPAGLETRSADKTFAP